jgi:hypothetical protein
MRLLRWRAEAHELFVVVVSLFAESGGSIRAAGWKKAENLKNIC